ncbi:hypothetical protein Tco_0132195 [Tanacetum coccineum]
MRFPDVPSTSIKLMLFPFLSKDRFNDLLRACPHHRFSELHQLDTFFNALNANDQDSLNFAAGGNFLDKMPRECLKIIESNSKVRNSRNKAVVAKVSWNSSTPGISPNVAALTTEVSELKNMMKTMLIDKQKTQAPVPVKAVDQSCVTCGGAHSYRNCPAIDGNVYRDNIQEYVSHAVAANFNQGHTNSRPPMVANQIRPPGFPPIQNNQNRFNQNQGNNFNQNRGTNFNQNHGNNFYQGQVYQPPTSQPPVYQAHPYQAPAPQMQGVSKTDFENYVKANDAILRNMQNQGQGLQNQMTNLTEMLSKFINSNTASTSSSGSLPSNTVTNPKEDLKGITTRSGVAYQGPTIPTTSSPKVVERRTEMTKDTFFRTNNEITKDVQPPVVPVENQNPVFEPVDAPVSAPMPNPKPSIPYPSRRNDEKCRENANEQKEKFYEIFKDMSFEISFVDALTLMPKFASTLKALIRNKEKLSEMARTPLNEHCSAVILNKLPEKLGDPGRFLIQCKFTRMDECHFRSSTHAMCALQFIIMAQQQHAADVHPDELCHLNKRYDLMDANKKVDLEHVQCPSKSKILMNIIKNHPLRFSIVASASVPWIYMAQFWHTLKEDGSKNRLKFLLDRKELKLTLDDFRTIFHLPQAKDNNHASFVQPSSFSNMVPFYKQVLGFTMDLKTVSNFKISGLLQPWQALCKIFSKCLTTRVTRWDQPPLQIMQMLYCFVNNIHVDYAELMWEGIYYSLHHPATSIPYPRFEGSIISHYIQYFLIGNKIICITRPRKYVFRRPTIQGPERRRTAPGESSGPARPNYASTVEETRISPIPSPTRSPRNLSTLVSSDTEKLQELTVTHPTPSSGSFEPKLTKNNRLLSMIKAKPNRFKRYKSFFHELQGRYGYLFAHLKKRFMPRTSSDQLADNLHDVMMETLPSLVKEKVTEQVKKEVPAQVRDQVPVYLAEGLILERKTTKEETERLISKAILQERGRMQAHISSQIQNAIDNAIPSLVDASVRSYMSGHILHVHPAQVQSSSVPEQQHQLYLAMKADPLLQQQDIAIWLALQMKFEKTQVPQTACRSSAVRTRDQDDPHDDAHPEGENSAKRQKTSEYEAYVSGESSSGQVNVEEPGPSTSGNQEQDDEFDFWTDSYASDDDEIPTKQVTQDIMEEISLTIDEAKLKKMADEMLRQRCTSGDEHQYHIDQMKNFLQSDIVWESRKEILVSPHPRKITPLVQSCQRDPEAPALSLINQDLLYLKKGNSGPEKIVLSLHKFPAIVFNDDDIEERTSRWVNKCIKKFNPYARYGVENWKNPHAKIFYIRRQKEPGRPKEEIYSNSKIVQVIKTYSAVRTRDQDDPHDDAHPEGENSAKRQKTSEYEAYVSGESSSGQVNVEEPGPSTSGNQEQDDEFDFWTDSYASDDDEIPTKQVTQDIMEEISLTIDEAKLKKMADEMLRQRCTSGDEHQYHIDQMKNFLQSDIVWESRKEILVSPHPRKITPLVQSCQRDPEAPALSLINQDLLYLKKGNSGPEKIVLSLHKFPAIVFNDDDIEERTSRWVNKCIKKFNPYARYGVENWKNPHAKIFYIRRQKEPGRPKEEIYSNSKIPDYKNLNKNDIEDMYLLIMNNKVPDYANTGLLWSLSVFIRSSVIWERVHDFQLGIESYQQKINLTAPTITFPGIEEYDVFSIVYEPVHGIIYTNSKKEKRVMRPSEIHKFCDATLRRTLEGLKSYYNDVKYGYVQKELTNDEVEFLKLFEEEIEVRLNYQDQMRRWEMYVNGRPLGPRREHLE